eukprot:scaffold11552_cov147-Skeletonema_marinoi.AAC.2
MMMNTHNVRRQLLLFLVWRLATENSNIAYMPIFLRRPASFITASSEQRASHPSNDSFHSNTVCSPYCKFQFPTSKITHLTQPPQINHDIRHQPQPPSIMAGCHHSQPFNMALTATHSIMVTKIRWGPLVAAG